jgi:hypothetical protein
MGSYVKPFQPNSKIICLFNSYIFIFIFLYSILRLPTTDEVTVRVIEDTEVSVVDMVGRVLKKETIKKDQNTINLSEFTS